MAKVKVRVLQATVDGRGPGKVISIEKKSADHLEKIGYVERVSGNAKDEQEDQDDKEKDSE